MYDESQVILELLYTNISVQFLVIPIGEKSNASFKVMCNKLEAVPSFLELAARAVVVNKIAYDPEDMFPQLRAYLGK